MTITISYYHKWVHKGPFLLVVMTSCTEYVFSAYSCVSGGVMLCMCYCRVFSGVKPMGLLGLAPSFIDFLAFSPLRFNSVLFPILMNIC